MFLLLTTFVMQFVVIGTPELIVGESPVSFSNIPLYTTIHRSYGMWRSCFEVRGLIIPGTTEEIGCVRPDNKCGNINALYQLIQAFGVLGVFFTSVAIIVQGVGITRRGSCYGVLLGTIVLGFLSMSMTLTIWAVAASLKLDTFCGDSFPILPEVLRADYHYGASFTIAVIAWIALVFYLINQLALVSAIRSHSRPLTKQMDNNA